MAQMEIVIKIPEEKYNEAQKRFKKGYTLGSLDMAILNGTVLPKGHGALKDTDAFDDICGWYHTDDDGSWCYKREDIIYAPTIIEADEED